MKDFNLSKKREFDMERESFTTELLNALEQNKKSEVSDDILNRMEKLTLNKIYQSSNFSTATLMAIAASFLLLVSANFILVNQNQSNTFVEEEKKESYVLIPAKSIYHE